ncbi:Cell cycle checkpoint protein RAD17 [Grifola frondosa]|uniref:Cell cycle checkpoint protein RAD17 n=1 Tax=Grifola frondosa TaxID=5627 RepID=A0A1C7MK51_GRIFR|nr:Cell cycle checkpoint protein RAD17 [Grifola frondosa]
MESRALSEPAVSTKDGRTRLRRACLLYIFPSFFVDPATFGNLPVMDGAFNVISLPCDSKTPWNSGWPTGNYNITFNSDASYISNLGNRSYMAAVSPWFFTHYSPQSYNKNFIYRGDDWLFAQRWELLVQNRSVVPFAQVATWNDFGESHYVGPIEGIQPNSQAWVNGFDHQGWLDLMQYYIAAYKTGSYPAIPKDRVFLWARLYSMNATAPTASGSLATGNGPPNVTISCGSTSKNSVVPAGLSKLKLLLSRDCAVKATVVRGAVTMVKFSPSGFTFRTRPPSYNFNACQNLDAPVNDMVKLHFSPCPSSFVNGSPRSYPSLTTYSPRILTGFAITGTKFWHTDIAMPSSKASGSQKVSKGGFSYRVASQPARLESPPFGPPPAKRQKTKPMMSLVRPPVFDLGASQTARLSQDVKGKGREQQGSAKEVLNDIDDQLWVDRYEPVTEGDLAVHKKKIQDVRQWLLEAFEGGPTGVLKKYRRILVLTGPAGTGKTTTLRVLSRELGFEILEWRNTMDEQFSRENMERVEFEGLSEKFQTFLTRASNCRSIFSGAATHTTTFSPSQSQSRPSQSSSMFTPSPSPINAKRQIILLEDLPNILHASTQAAFHAALEAFVASPDPGVAPLVIIVSDAGLRGENTDDDVDAWRGRKKEAVDVRNVLPPSLLNSPYVTQIGFNAIAATYLRPALKNMLDNHFLSSSGTRPSKDVMDIVVDSSNGDIRSAVMALQFACIRDYATDQRKPTKGRKRTAGLSARVVMEAVTRREQSLALFHLIGKVMYNKRKGDPPNSSASAKDKQRDRELDARLKDLPPLPTHLKEHERRASRVDIENYVQYCDTLDECDSLIDRLSWADSNGGESWHQANPHRFHLLTLGTLHALPSPVTRRSQKPYKPAFFEALRKEREAEDGLTALQNEEWRAQSWSQRDVALELGAVLKARDQSDRNPAAPPLTYRLFSRLEFSQDAVGLEQLAEDGDVSFDVTFANDESRLQKGAGSEEGVRECSWLEDDDIEDF